LSCAAGSLVSGLVMVVLHLVLDVGFIVSVSLVCSLIFLVSILFYSMLFLFFVLILIMFFLIKRFVLVATLLGASFFALRIPRGGSSSG
jgi:hypothetical protein